MGIIKNKLKEQVEANNLKNHTSTTGTILEYDMITNRAKIKFPSPLGEGVLIRENVPVSTQTGGFTQAGIRRGTECNITFYNNNIFAPMITGINDSFYNDKTCSDQGACLINEKIKSVSKPEEIIPMSSQWIDENNNDPYKYNNDLWDYHNTDIIDDIINCVSKITKYTDKEEGVTNLDTKSTIKFRENGDIDIFVANNIGIRINKSNKRIDIYGDLYINGKKYIN